MPPQASTSPPLNHLGLFYWQRGCNEAATRRGLGGPGGQASGCEWGCQHLHHNKYQHCPQKSLCLPVCLWQRKQCGGCRLNRRCSGQPFFWPRARAGGTLRGSPTDSNPHSGCASSLRYTGTCSATAVQPAHQCLNVPPFVVAGHGELSWPRGQALGPGNSRFYLSNNPATADLRLGGGPWESWRTPGGATHDIPGYSCGYFEEHGALALAPGP